MLHLEVLSQIDLAFSATPPPGAFCACDCDECAEMALSLSDLTREEFTVEDAAWFMGPGTGTSLVRHEVIRYFMPSVVAQAFASEERVTIVELVNFISLFAPSACRSYERYERRAIVGLLEYVRDHLLDSIDEHLNGHTRRTLAGALRRWSS